MTNPVPANAPARFCPRCLDVSNALDTCSRCNLPLEILFDPHGALTAAFLRARRLCCYNGCTHCPYNSSIVTSSLPQP